MQEFLSHLAINRDVSARSRRLPVVLTPQEASRVIAHLEGGSRLVVQLLYGSGLRLMEALALRAKDLEFERRELIVRNGKGSCCTGGHRQAGGLSYLSPLLCHAFAGERL